MIFIETDSTCAYYNFAAEYYLMTERQLDDTAFMFWRTQPTLMVGRFQNTYREVNLDYVERNNIKVVRRMSGGGTIYTDMGGWQFTFITKGNNGEIGFTEFLEPVVAALRKIGTDVSFSGRNDLVVAGKKFSGNAQYIKAGHTLHHGSILFSTDIGEMVRSTTVDEHKIVSKGIKSVRERVTNISEHLPVPMTMEEFKATMVESIMQGEQNVYSFTDTDITRIKAIEAEQFRDWDKVFGKSPLCSIQKTRHFPGGTIQCHLDVDKGRIREIKIYGDFFGDISIDTLCERLVGCRYQKEDVQPIVKDSIGSIYGISVDEFIGSMF